MSFNDYMTEDRRRCTLVILHKSGGYQANEYLIQAALNSQGHQVSADRVRTDLQWLAEQSLCTVESISNVSMATLTEKGGDVVAGTSIVPGVRRPRAGE